jgi:predicted RNA-binding Zn-ribbon protein involved in translation (DUF1610 family)
MEDETLVCSDCGETLNYDFDLDFWYCPNCQPD